MQEYNVSRNFPEELIPAKFTNEPMTAIDVLRVDLFTTLYSFDPTPNPNSDLEALETLDALRAIIRGSVFKTIKEMTTGNKPLAMYATQALTSHLKNEELLTITEAQGNAYAKTTLQTTAALYVAINVTGTESWISSLDEAHQLEVLRLIGTSNLLHEYIKARRTSTSKDEWTTAGAKVEAKFVYGSDITKLSPRDLTSLTTPGLQTLFWQGYATSTLENTSNTQEPKNNGGYVIVIDESTSVTTNDLVKARAVALQLAESAALRGATCKIITCAGDKVRIYTPINDGDRSETITFLTTRLFGTTNLQHALDTASALTTENDHAIVITDGHRHEAKSEAWDAMRSTGIPTTGIAIGNAEYALKNYTDTIINIT